MTRADLKHCGKVPDARDELNRSVREGRIQSRHSIQDQRESDFLFQRVSLAILRGNAFSILQSYRD